jgi:uroporphyrinogen decarboxylase
MMNSRERLQLALNHDEPDRVPFDLSATDLTGIHHKAYRALRRYLGLPDKELELINIIQQIVKIDQDVYDKLECDVRSLTPGPSSTFQLNIKEKDGYSYFYGEWGIGWKKPLKGGWYYDMFDHPFEDANTIADIENHPWPDPLDETRFEGMAERAAQIAQVEKQGVFLWGIGAGILEMAAYMRGYDNYFIDFASNEKILVAVMRKVLELKMAYWEKALALVGDNVDAVQEADDFAGQYKMLISPDMYRRIVKPLHKELFDFIHAHTKAKVFFHSCGAIRPVIPDLIEIGVDILNPIQVSAVGMDSAELKQEYGNELVFWGGGVDTQRVLGDGTPDDVREDTKRRIFDLAPGGGFVFASIHNIQGNVPPENIMAMWNTLQDYGKYPIQG